MTDSDDTQTLPDNKTFAVVDLGSNSFHMIVSRMVMGSLQQIQRRKEQVQLAAGMDDSEEMDPAAMRRGIECLERMGQILRDLQTDQVRVVATHTLREARNRGFFILLAEHAVGYPVEVISGREEARLIFQGVAHTEPLSGPALVIDIGGGSTELAVGEGFDPQYRVSRSMGCVSYSQTFFKKNLSEKAFLKAQTAALQQLEHSLHKFRMLPREHVFATSGTARSLSKAVQLVDGDTELVHLKDLKALRDFLIEKQDLSILTKAGVNETRCQIFPGGLAIMISVMEALGLEAFRYSEAELSVGVLYEMEDLMRHDNIRVRTRKSIQARYQIDQEHAQHVADTCERLWQQVAKDWGVSDPLWGELLLEAAQLHEVGLQISGSSLHQHSGYILANSDLPGYNQEQQQILSLLVSNYRKRLKPDNIPGLHGIGQKKLIRLIRLLRLGVLLNNSRVRIPLDSFQLQACGRGLTLHVDEEYLNAHELVRADLEQEAGLMEKIDCMLMIDTVDGGASPQS